MTIKLSFVLCVCSFTLLLLGPLTGPTLGQGAPAEESASEAALQPAGKIVRLTLRGQVFESSPPMTPFGGSMGATLPELVGVIEKAAKSDSTVGLIVRIQSPMIGWTQIQTMRRALVKYRQSGKPSYCFLESADNASYLIASACTDVSLLPNGLIHIPGLALHTIFFKDLLDKVGVEFQELRMGRYKGAVEALTRSEPSDPIREERHALIDELFEEYVDSISENRDLRPVVVRGLVDQAWFNAEEAKAAALVDAVEHHDEFLARTVRNKGGDHQVVDARLGKKIDLQVGGFAGMMNLFNELFSGPKKSRRSRKAKIAVVNGVGAIVQGPREDAIFGGPMMVSDQIAKIFQSVRDDETVKAVVFRVNSPGGSALASEVILREVKLTAEKKPVIVSMGDLAASGGYYVSCGATWIVAERGTLTGSIGVIGAIPNMRELFENIGIGFESFTRGKRANGISAYGEMTDDTRAVLASYMRKIYDEFLARVASGRELPRDAVASVAEGRVWTGRQALKHGLVDELGGLDTAIAKARELGEITEDPEILSLPEPKTFFDVLQEMEGGGTITMRFAESLPIEIRQYLRPFEWLRATKREPVMMALPDLHVVK